MDGETQGGVWQAAGGVGPLAGVRVVDLGQYVAGPLAAMLLADQGADVIRIDPPGGPRWDSPVNAVLLRGRRTVELDLHDTADRLRAQALVASADVVIEGFRPAVAARLGVGPDAVLARSPHVVYCSLPGFGSTDPRADVAAWDGVVMAAAGAYSFEALFSFGHGDGVGTVFSPLALGSVFGALEAALSITAALIARQRDGYGQHVEVPLFDALFEAIGLRGVIYEHGFPPFTDFGSGFYRCGDGRYLTFIATWFRHLEWFVDAAGCHGWIDEGLVNFDRLWKDPDAGKELIRRLAALFATRPAREWEALGWEHGCTIGMLRATDEWMAEPHAVASGTLVDVDDPVLGSVRVPGAAVCLGNHPEVIAPPRGRPGRDPDGVLAALDSAPPEARTPPTGERDDRPPLAGRRVLDTSRVVAAPTAAKLLGQLGADVVKIDADPATSTAAFTEPAFHEHLNRGKQTMIVDLHDDAGRRLFARLAAEADVIVQNFSLGTAERIGIDDASVRRTNPDVVYLYLNAYGRRGPWARNRGYAELANITTGVTERSVGGAELPSGTSASMDQPRWTFTDYAAGVLGAFGSVLALYDRGRTGRGQLVETSLARATTLEQILYAMGSTHAAGGWRPDRSSEPRGASARGWTALQRLYETSDGTIFVGARREQLADLWRVLGVAPVPDDSDREVVAGLERAFAALTTAEACTLLRAADVGVQAVTSLVAVMAPGGMADQRGLRLEERSPHLGTIVMPGPVVRFGRTPMRPGALPGPFGSDRDAVLQRLGPDPS
jgi:crotonobetainyl-CoA:carnitine CoA-transferase CaiB-like acyl-CoA transferase